MTPFFADRRKGVVTSYTHTYGEAFVAAKTGANVSGSFTTHDSRHFYASLLIAQNVDLATVQANLGHSSPGETLRTYTHLWPDNSDVTRRAVDAVLS